MKQSLRLDSQAAYWCAKIQSSSISTQELDSFFIWLEQSPQHQIAYLKAERLVQSREVLLEMKQSAPAKSRLLLNWPFMLSASTAVIVLISVLFIWDWDWDDHNSQRFEAQYLTSIGGYKEVDLPDGSHIALNTATEVEVHYTKDRRSVLLKTGEVYVDVASNPEKPFQLLSSHGRLQVIGTSFLARKLDNDLSVYVEEGRVGITSAVQKDFSPDLILEANQKVLASEASRGEGPSAFTRPLAFSWKNRKLIFEDVELAHVISEVNRYIDYKVGLDNEINNRKITFIVNLDNIDAAVQQLATALDLNIKEQGNNKFLYKKRTL